MSIKLPGNPVAPNAFLRARQGLLNPALSPKPVPRPQPAPAPAPRLVATHLVTFDLIREGLGYADKSKRFYELLNALGKCVLQPATTTVYLNSLHSTEKLYDTLRTAMDGNDHLTVQPITAQGYVGHKGYFFVIVPPSR